MTKSRVLLASVLLFAAACATTRPEAPAIRDARLAVQDARDAGAQDRAPEKFNRAASDLGLAQHEWNSGHEGLAMHYAQIADSEARDAEYQARGAKAETAFATQRSRRDRLAAELHEAEERAIAARAQSEAERRRLEAELRAREEEARLQSEAQAHLQLEAQQRAAEDRERALQAQLEAERQRAAEQQRQAQVDELKAQLEQQSKAAEEARRAAAEQAERNAKLEEARRQEEERRKAAEESAEKQRRAQNDLVVRLQLLEKSTRVEARGIVVTLPGNIYFATNRSDLQPGIRARLADIGKALASAPDRHVVVEGHTDSTGRADYNLKLSQLRAESVKAVLLANGVAPDRIETQGYGATKPVASNAAPSGRSQNRRVEIIVQGTFVPVAAPAPEPH